MINLQKLSLSDTSFLKKVRLIYENAFPPNERRAFEDVLELLEDKRFSLFAVTFGNEVIGMLSKWDFDTFVYIEHFAISAAFRCKGMGSHVFKQLMMAENRQIVLEVELPENEIAVKRICFYERFGCIICHEPYIQPPYDKNKASVPMLIMTKYAISTSNEFNKIKKTLHLEVYRWMEPLS